MSEMKKLQDEHLEGVTGGSAVTVFNDSEEYGYANVRELPSLSGPIMLKAVNGRQFPATGNVINADGIDWYEVIVTGETAGFGWIAGGLLKFSNEL